ncbi:MAG: hypothetical protein AB1490_18550 [Pseudomonadota bacterium]
MGVSSNLRKALAFGAFASVLLSSSSAFSACYSGRAALSPQQVSDFMANPGALLQQAGPNDNARVISRVRDLVASDPSTLPAVMNLLGSTGNSSLQTAIGAGLGQAARICTRNDPEFARAIQQAVAQSSVPAAAQTAFAGASGDRSTAAGGAGGGGGGGVGGSTGSGAPGGGGGGGGTTGAGSPGNGTSSPTVSSGGSTTGGTAGLSSQSASP